MGEWSPSNKGESEQGQKLVYFMWEKERQRRTSAVSRTEVSLNGFTSQLLETPDSLCSSPFSLAEFWRPGRNTLCSIPHTSTNFTTGCQLGKSSSLSWCQKEKQQSSSPFCFATAILHFAVFEIFFDLQWFLLHFVITSFLPLPRERWLAMVRTLTKCSSPGRNELGKWISFPSFL